jgi:hypothetical protein
MKQSRVAKLREVRRLLRAGWAVAEITRTVGIDGGQIANQRKLMALTDRVRSMSVAEAARGLNKGRHGRFKGRAEVSGDLCDIFAAGASRGDLRFAFAGSD